MDKPTEEPAAPSDASARRASKGVFASSGLLSVLTLVSRVLGLVRDQTRAALMGTGGLAEAFTAAFNVPNLMRRLFAEGSMAAAFVPTLKDYLSAGNPPGGKETRSFLSAVFTVLLVLLALVVAAGIASAGLVVRVMGTDPAETALLVRIMFPFLALASVAAFLQGMLNSGHVFAPAGVAPILFNLCFILVPGIVTPWTGNAARGMAVAVLAGGLLQALCQLPAVLKAGFRFGFMNPLAAFAHPGTRKVMALIAPTLLGMAAYEINSFVSISLATHYRAATALQMSLRLQELILGIYVVSIGTVILPLLSGQAASGDWKAYNARLRSSVDAVTVVTLPVSAFCLFMGKDIVSLLFQIGQFGEASVDLTAGAFFFHSLGLFFIGQNRILAPAFYARKDSKSPAAAGIASFAVNVACAFALSRLMGGKGIALAVSVAALVNTAILVVLLARKKETDRKALARTGLYALKILAFSAAASAPVLLLAPRTRSWAASLPGAFLQRFAPIAASGLLFALIGVGLLIITRDPNVFALLRRFKRSKRGTPETRS